MRLVPGGEPFDRVLRTARTRAFHLENYDNYLATGESDSLRQFLADETTDPGGEWFTPWADQVRRMVGDGIVMQRARIVSEPHTDYTRFLLALARHNVAAGEDVRYLPRADTDVVSEDFWLLDDSTVVFSLFDLRGFWSGGAATSDSRMVRHAADIRDKVWPAAIPYRDYLTRLSP
ncbi:DUF6879 family protein [Nocardia sp. NPDC050710]|uniref:DUF6879 family protein n=1 Tax=Nocardia sp. NPDC050710 TaxID=3157220 RepID=UPI0033D265F6